MQFRLTSSPKRIRDKLAAATATFALLGMAGMLSSGTASASASRTRQDTAALHAALSGDLNHYLSDRRTAEHISAVSLRVTFPGSRPPVGVATGTTRYDGGPPVPAGALWQIGSNTKAFTAVIILQLEAEGKLSISDPIGRWLPQYPAWRHITVRQLLDMTSRIPDYLYQPAFAIAFAANQDTRFTAARLVSYVAGLPLGPAGYHYSNTDYILAQMLIEKVTHDSYADQLTKRIVTPLGLHTTCLAPYTCPASDAGRVLRHRRRPAVADGQARTAPGPDLGSGGWRDCQLTGRHDHLGPRPLPGIAPPCPPAGPVGVPGVPGHRQAHPPRHRR
jgi:D-alanyl-D-alanine carboxypeptidase